MKRDVWTDWWDGYNTPLFPGTRSVPPAAGDITTTAITINGLFGDRLVALRALSRESGCHDNKLQSMRALKGMTDRSSFREVLLTVA